ncbi:hypothetical protein ACIGD1_29195 [Streptomyces sp. NPDC085612]|uniref:hypothetical protein n=1 Tax=Streptomyces sp. NPDC085612 TaxID=3365732 RepID=UPI0037D8CE3A
MTPDAAWDEVAGADDVDEDVDRERPEPAEAFDFDDAGEMRSRLPALAARFLLQDGM